MKGLTTAIRRARAMTTGRAAALGLLIALAAPLCAAPAFAQSQIKVVVNDQPITSYEIAQRAKLLQVTTKSPNAVQAATQELIDERLKMQEAEKRGITVSDAEVNAAFASIAEHIKMKPDQLAAALAHSGASAQTLKARLRAQIAWGDVVRAKFRRDMDVSDQDVVAAMQQQSKGGKGAAPADKATTMQYDLTQIILVVPAKDGPGKIQARMKEGEALRQRFTSCDQGIPFAKQLPAVVVKPVGRRLQSDLPPATVDVLNKTAIGHLTPPEAGPDGVRLVAVCDKKDIASDAAARQDIKQQLIQQEGDIAARRYLRELENDAVIEYR